MKDNPEFDPHLNNPKRVLPFQPVSELDHFSKQLAQEKLQNAELEATRRLCWQLITKLGGEYKVDTADFAAMPKDAALNYERTPEGKFRIYTTPKNA